VGLASRGQRNLDGGVETVGDAAELAQLKRQSRKVVVKSLASAAMLTAGLLAVP
jgi:hypothetical protein